MNAFRYLSTFVALSVMLMSACSAPPGRPGKDSEDPAPSDISDFRTLFADNCAACHGADGRGGAAIALADPVYLAVADESSMRTTIANGVRGTSMPAFAQSVGGTLTDKQIDEITSKVRSHWGRPGILDGANPPSYRAKASGDVERGEASYRTYCSTCHGPEGQGGAKGSAITNDSFLALVSDQGLRTMIIAGRPELGAPDWRGNTKGKPMSEQEISDVVAWLASHRVQSPGRPYPLADNTQLQELKHGH